MNIFAFSCLLFACNRSASTPVDVATTEGAAAPEAASETPSTPEAAPEVVAATEGEIEGADTPEVETDEEGAAGAEAEAAADAPEGDAAAPASDLGADDEAARDAVYKALIVRDAAPPCSELEAMTTTPAATFLYLVENASQPPWVGIRAAECLIQGHAQSIQPQLESWVSNSETKGLGYLALNHLDAMPIEVATSVATAALAGPEAEGARSRIQNAQTPEIRALAD